jgi:hypothetical protein
MVIQADNTIPYPRALLPGQVGSFPGFMSQVLSPYGVKPQQWRYPLISSDTELSLKGHYGISDSYEYEAPKFQLALKWMA